MTRRQPLFICAVVLLATSVSAAVSRAAPVWQAQVSTASLLQSALDDYIRGGSGIQRAEATADKVIVSLLALPALDDLQLRQLLTAHELRGRARYAPRSTDGAREDFKAILTRAPSHNYGSLTEAAGPVNPNSKALFEEVRKSVVATLVLNVTPEDAEVLLDGSVLPPAVRNNRKEIVVVAGNHRVSAQKSGHRRRDEEVAATAGTVTNVNVALERVTSRFDVMTSPPGVEVWLDGVLKGRTPEGPPSSRYSGAPDVVGLGSGREVSGGLEILDVQSGDRRFELKLDCYTTESVSRAVEQPGDFYIAKRLTRSSARLAVNGNGGRVFIDGEFKGLVPYEQELCPKPQPQVVEIRSDRGRQIRRVSPIAGGRIDITANPKPAIAILSQTNVPDGFRDDLRQELEAALATAEGVTFFALAPDLVQREMTAERLMPGWLSFDATGQPLTPAALGMSASTRLRTSANISTRLEVQGIAEINAPAFSRDPRLLLLTYLAAGSSVPETLQVKTDDAGSVRRAVAFLSSRYSTAAISSGIQVADVQGAGGAVVLRQDWDLTGGELLARGDVIQVADGRKVEDGSAFDALVAARKPGDQIALQVKGASGAVRVVQLKPVNFPRVVGFYDETLPINKLLLDFRLAVLDAQTARERAIASLNLGVVLMRAGNWTDAKAELDKVDLPDLTGGGQGISRGTVQYYLGLCLDKLERFAEATKAFTAAANSPGAWLTADGPLVKPLADEKLKDPKRPSR